MRFHRDVQLPCLPRPILTPMGECLMSCFLPPAQTDPSVFGAKPKTQKRSWSFKIQTTGLDSISEPLYDSPLFCGRPGPPSSAATTAGPAQIPVLRTIWTKASPFPYLSCIKLECYQRENHLDRPLNILRPIKWPAMDCYGALSV